MSMLAEPRSRQKWSEDPRNINWASDKTKFGYQMLTKMGWSEGLGLGQNLSGNISHIKVKKTRDNAGVGLKKSHDDDWISHQDDFNALLNSLNQNSSGSAPQKISSLEDRVKSSKKKILYKKFIKSKDLSNASSHDLACIFGQRGKPAPVVPQDRDDEEISESLRTSHKELAVQTVETGVSVADYFAKRMAAMKEKKSQENHQNTSERTANAEEESSPESKKKKKEKTDDFVITENVEIESNIPNSEEGSCPERKKKKKKQKTNDSVITESTEIESNIPNGDEESCPERKKKKKKQKTNDSVITESTEVESNILSKKRINEEVLVLESGMVKRKKKNDYVKIDQVTDNSSEQLEKIKKKKKKKKEKREIDSNK